MPVNALTTEASLKVGPLVLETLIKHYFDRKKTTLNGKPITALRQDELMYDEVFNIVKSFLRAASFHTVEDVQGFANTRTPSPPWVHVVRLIVPMQSCNEAAKYLIVALGGEEAAKRIVGGVKWWQVRGINGVDAQWITAKKDWREAKRRHKMQQKTKETNSLPTSMDTPSEKSNDSGAYQKDMDEMRCILYSHGGGYYFGSVDQERYSIQRHARKINGRVFAVNYRLAPQYPFPCALQDLLAAYIFLIRPPPGATHCPVNPAHIVVAGDSAGGGLSLALLQVIRDSGLPSPAGGVLISPWCDLTHSFASVHGNTTTDILPEWGLSFHKPSVLWPPPTEEISSQVHASLRSRIREVFQADKSYNHTANTRSTADPPILPEQREDATKTSISDPSQRINQTVSLVVRSGEILTTSEQLHMYTQNSLLSHPLVSPVTSYLGGLPPLLFIAGEQEVLRDEIIYTAHKAASPERYPISDSARAVYPVLKAIEGRYRGTKVQLQVYDDAAHVLPVLFSFTTPAKYCFRAIAAFCKHVTGVTPSPATPPFTPFLDSSSNVISHSSFGRNYSFRLRTEIGRTSSDIEVASPIPDSSHRQSLRRSLSATLHRTTSRIRPRLPFRGQSEVVIADKTSPEISSPPDREDSAASSDVAGPRFESGASLPQSSEDTRVLTAGDPRVYGEKPGVLWPEAMLRERVSTQGVVRPLEPEEELDAFRSDDDAVGKVCELTLRRYLNARTMFDKKFAHTIRSIDKNRRHNLKLATKDTQQNMVALHQTLLRGKTSLDQSSRVTSRGIGEGLLLSTESWSWAWVLDGDERPPPSSIVSRRDTAEARHLARVADQPLFQDDQALSGNRFWSAVVNFLTVTPDRRGPMDVTPRIVEGASRFSQFFHREPTASGADGLPS